MGGNLFSRRFGFPDDLLDTPAVAVIHGLDAVDPLYLRLDLAVRIDAGFIGAPKMGQVTVNLGLDLDLMLHKRSVAALAHCFDPAVDGQNVRGKASIHTFGERNQRRLRQKKRAEASPVLVRRSGDGGVDGFDQIVERGSGGAGGGRRLRVKLAGRARKLRGPGKEQSFA